MCEKDLQDLRNDMNKLRKSLQDEMMKQMQEAQAEKDEKDESSGAIVFVKGEGGNKQIKGATPEKLVERLTDPISYGMNAQLIFVT